MRKVVFAISAIAGLVAGCTSIECSMNNIVASQYCFMDHVKNDNDTAIKVTEYYLTVSTKKTVEIVDTVLINKKTDISTLQLPVSYNQKEDILYFLNFGKAVRPFIVYKVELTLILKKKSASVI